MAKCVFMESLFSLIMVPKHKNVDFVADAGTPQTSHKASFWWGGKQTEKLFWERKQPHSHSFLMVCHHNLHGCCSSSLHMIQTWVFVMGVHWRPSAGFGALSGLRLFLSLWTHGLWIRRDRNYWTSLCKLPDLGHMEGAKGAFRFH